MQTRGAPMHVPCRGLARTSRVFEGIFRARTAFRAGDGPWFETTAPSRILRPTFGAVAVDGRRTATSAVAGRMGSERAPGVFVELGSDEAVVAAMFAVPEVNGRTVSTIVARWFWVMSPSKR